MPTDTEIRQYVYDLNRTIKSLREEKQRYIAAITMLDRQIVSIRIKISAYTHGEPVTDYCDYGHPAPDIRRLGFSNGAGALLCERHYHHMRAHRSTEGLHTPLWAELPIYTGA